MISSNTKFADRLSFVRFLGLVLEDKVPDAKTVWLYREQLAQAGMTTTEFENFDSSLKDRGYLATGGQIIDASIVSVPTQHNKPLSERENQDKASQYGSILGYLA